MMSRLPKADAAFAVPSQQAMFWDAPRASVVEAPVPEIAPGDALVRATLLGVTPTDRAIIAGRVQHRGVMGQLFVGVVEQAAALPRDQPRASAWIGKRVVGWPVWVCGQCDFCRGGLSAHCPSRRMMGVADVPGCFATRFAAPLATLVELPPALTDERALLATALGVALHATATIRPEAKPYITILGDGPVGLLAALLLAQRSQRVRLLGKHAAKLAICERWNIKHRHVGEAGRRADQDVLLDCTGTAQGLRDAVAMTRPRGRIVLVAPSAPEADEPRRECWDQVASREIEVVGARGCRLAEAVALLARGEIDAERLITRRTRLGPEALARDNATLMVAMTPA